MFSRGKERETDGMRLADAKPDYTQERIYGVPDAEKTLDLHIFSRIGKTMKKVQ